MKCEHCGKNEVNFVYQSNVNGKVESAHLCSDCAQKLGYTQKIAANRRNMAARMENMNRLFGGGLLDDFFNFTPRLLGGSLFGENLFDDFFQQMPALTAGAAAPQQAAEKPLVEEADSSRFSAQRQRNALKMEQKAAIAREDFEKAAQIRDQIRQMEADQGQNAQQ
jgi:protein arginine kinase activator